MAGRFPTLFYNSKNYKVILERVDIDLLVTYLSIKSDVTKNGDSCIYYKPIRNKYGENMLHLLAKGHYIENISAEAYHKTLISIAEIPYFKLSRLMAEHLNGMTEFGWRAVDVAICSLNLSDETLSYFVDLGIRLDKNDLLAKAVASQRPGAFLKQIISKSRDKAVKQTLLQIAAAKYNFSAVKYFVEDCRLVVNKKDNDGNTALHMCFIDEAESLEMTNSYASFDTYAESLCKHTKENRDPTGKSKKRKNQNELNRSACCQDLNLAHEPINQHKIIAYLIQKKAKINISNNQGFTPLDLAIDVCLGGLRGEQYRTLENAKKKLFDDRKLMTIALKGLLLNQKLGDLWHPSLIESFAKAISRFVGNVNVKERLDEISLLHFAAKYHSYFGVKFLTEKANLSPTITDKNERTPIDYMNCNSECQIYNCKEIKKYLSKKTVESMPIVSKHAHFSWYCIVLFTFVCILCILYIIYYVVTM